MTINTLPNREHLMVQDPLSDSGIFTIRGDLDGAKETAAFSEVRQFIGLLIKGEEFFFPIEVMNEIIMINQITFVPRSPCFIEGVINLRGKILPAINLRRMMGHETIKPTPASRIIIASYEDVVAALIVDGITYVVSLSPNQVEEQTLNTKGHSTELIKGISKRGDRVNGILDIEKVLVKVGFRKLDEDEENAS